MADERIYHAERTCNNCTKKDTCWALREMEKVIDNWQLAGFVGAGAPGWKGDMTLFLAHGCLHFQFSKTNKVNG